MERLVEELSIVLSRIAPLVVTNGRHTAARDQENDQHCNCLTHRNRPFFNPPFAR